MNPLHRVAAREGIEIGAHGDLGDAEQPAQFTDFSEAPLLDDHQDLLAPCHGRRSGEQFSHALIFDYLRFLVNHG
jgi:hypothetical protein